MHHINFVVGISAFKLIHRLMRIIFNGTIRFHFNRDPKASWITSVSYSTMSYFQFVHKSVRLLTYVGR